MNAETMYTTLAQLNVGDPVPASVYILDYRDGTLPSWTVEARRDLGADGVQLILADGPVVHVDVVEPTATPFPPGFCLGAKVQLRDGTSKPGWIIGLINYQGDPVVDVVHEGAGRMAYQADALQLVPDPRDAVIAAARRWQAEADPNETLTAGERALADALDALKA